MLGCPNPSAETTKDNTSATNGGRSVPGEKKYYLAIARELSGGRNKNGLTFCFCTRSLNAKRFLCFTLSSALLVYS